MRQQPFSQAMIFLEMCNQNTKDKIHTNEAILTTIERYVNYSLPFRFEYKEPGTRDSRCQ